VSTISVTTQAELDAALATAALPTAPPTTIVIGSPRGVWLNLGSSGSATVEAYDSATVRAYGSATVEAYDSATVEASGSATVRAYDSATVRAYDSATVRAYDSATVRAKKYVAVHLFSSRVTLDGGVLINLTALDLTVLEDWVDYTGTETAGDDDLVLYKAVNDDLRSPHGFSYPIGEQLVCPDWRDTNDCGYGLHLSPTPAQAAAYHSTATRFLRCRVARVDVRPIGAPGETAKCKVRALTVEAEVDIHGLEVTAVAGAA
jgi:hypothetical protein